MPRVPCPVCDTPSPPLDVVDFNKTCLEASGPFLERSGEAIYYHLCENCQFCFAPEFARWQPQDFAARIYNDDYVLFDPDYRSARPRTNAQLLQQLFGTQRGQIRHLDFGGGGGLLSELLRSEGWCSLCYDPFSEQSVAREGLGVFDLVTAFEVFEHVVDVQGLVDELSSLLAPEGVILFSTLISDGQIAPRQRLTWWYAAPRNGHISLFSRRSLSVLAAAKGFRCHSFSAGLHAFWRRTPPWAAHALPGDGA